MVPDQTAPTAPQSFAIRAYSRPVRVALTWVAATDNVKVAGYRITRNGALLTTVAGTSFTDSAVAGGATYRYAVTAIDAAGNRGPSTATLQLTTPRK
jgi:chitinase